MLRSDVADEVQRLKQQVDGGILVAGSRTVVHSLIEQGLVDELRLMVFPVILGSGDRVFPDTPEKTMLELVDTKKYGNVLVHVYEPAKTR
ncbi:MAG TPA: dihydrofolate reductase family protein [Gaiellaceae bacterium]|nr:dihydrofolate reductase family protein [Gaiellaceae bacterium]